MANSSVERTRKKGFNLQITQPTVSLKCSAQNNLYLQLFGNCFMMQNSQRKVRFLLKYAAHIEDNIRNKGKVALEIKKNKLGLSWAKLSSSLASKFFH